MQNRGLGWSGLVALSLVLGAAACGDDDDAVKQRRDSGTGSADGASTGEADARAPDGDDGGRDASAPPADSGQTSGDADAAGDDAGETTPNIVELAIADGRFTTLAKALTDADLVTALQGEGPFTVFAPTDAAFAALGAETLNSLTTEQLATILKYHVVPAQVLSTDLEAGPVTTLSGFSAFVSTTDGAMINGANVTTADVRGSNGVIHVIDKVLLPPDVVEAAQLAGSFTSLVATVTEANLVDTLKTTEDITVFAPTDAAFAELGQETVDGLTVAQLTDVLTYHVVPQRVLSTELMAGMVPTLLSGEELTISLTDGVMVNDANVVIADVVATNGVIHVIDKVLLPPAD